MILYSQNHPIPGGAKDQGHKRCADPVPGKRGLTEPGGPLDPEPEHLRGAGPRGPPGVPAAPLPTTRLTEDFI